MDKKLICRGCGLILLSCMVLVGLLAGCGREESQSNAQLTLTPVGLSEDAKMLARTLGYESDDVQLFEYQLEGAEADSSQSLVLEIWRFEDSRWQKQVGAVLEVQQENKILMVNSADGFWVIADYLMNRNNGYYCATEVWRRTPSWHSWSYGCLQEAVTLEPGEEAWLRTQYEIVEDSDVVIMPEYSQESFWEDLAVEGCVVLTATFTVAE